MVSSIVITASDYIRNELQPERYGFNFDDFEFELPFNAMEVLFKEHYSNIFFYAGQVMGRKSLNPNDSGYYGIQLSEYNDNNGQYKLDFFMCYEIHELQLGEECSELIHEYKMKKNREENLKMLLDK